jgi:hypothetical protein
MGCLAFNIALNRNRYIPKEMIGSTIQLLRSISGLL